MSNPVSRRKAHPAACRPHTPLAALVALGAALSLAPAAALAHATFETNSAAQNSTYKAVIRVPHGCNGEATQTLRVSIPEGMIAVKPMPKPGWSLETKTGDFAQSYTLYGREVRQGVKEIIWSGGALADEHYDEFVFQARLTEALPAGETLFVPVVQECANGKVSWTEIPQKGQDAHALKSPAPGILILAQASAPQAATSYRAGALTISQPWSRATPGGARVAGGFMTITNNGSTPDRLVGGSAEIAKHFEVHEMAMQGGVMKMRALDKGLEIAPGASVELKPGGYHVMFIDIAKPFTEGQSVKGHLVFEKAGKVEVEFVVGPRGAASAGGHQH